MSSIIKIEITINCENGHNIEELCSNNIIQNITKIVDCATKKYNRTSTTRITSKIEKI